MCAVCVPEPVTRLPGSASGTCFAGPHSPWSPPFAPLAPPQFLHRGLLRRVLRVVRRLHSYYGEVRLPTPVHHRLRLLTFPMRTRTFSSLVRRGISQVPTRSVCA